MDEDPNVARCLTHGTQGQRQHGVDLVAFRSDGLRDAVQCKCEENFQPHEITEACDEFVNNIDHWKEPAIRRFVLAVACPLERTQQTDEITKQQTRLAAIDIVLDPWDLEFIDRKLRRHPDILDRFFEFVKLRSGTTLVHSAEKRSAIGGAGSAIPGHTIERLGEALSDSTEEKLQSIRARYLEGQVSDARKWVSSTKADETVWTALRTEVRASILRFESSLILDADEDIEKADELAEEARTIAPEEDDSRLRALIARKRDGPAEAIRVLEDRLDTESVQLTAALHLEAGDGVAAERLLDGLSGEDSETHRLRALVYLENGRLDEARLSADQAISIDPDRIATRLAGALVRYASALSPACRPAGQPLRPKPVPWSMVRVDDDSQEQLQKAAAWLEGLSKLPELPRAQSRNFNVWRLACLCCCTNRGEDADDLAKDLVEDDPTDPRVLSWVLARGIKIDLGQICAAAQIRLGSDGWTLGGCISIVMCLLELGRYNNALRMLSENEVRIHAEGQEGALGYWRAAAYSAAGETEKASIELAALESIDGLGHRIALSVHMEHRARDYGEWRSFLAFLERQYQEHNDATLLLEACSVAARLEEWNKAAELSRDLVGAIETREAARLAAIIAHKVADYGRCHEILTENRSLFPGGQLDHDLSELLIEALVRLGLLPEASRHAEASARIDQSTPILLNLVRLRLEMGDLGGAVSWAKKLEGREDLEAHNALQVAANIFARDLDLARRLWRGAVSKAESDEDRAAAYWMAFSLGLESEARPLFNSLKRLAKSESSMVWAVSVDDFREMHEDYRQKVEAANIAYLEGKAPVHLVAEATQAPVHWIYRGLPAENETSPRLRPLIMAFHGGRGSLDIGLAPENTDLCLDITAVLLAEHLGILTTVERSFRQLWLPPTLVAAVRDGFRDTSEGQLSREHAIEVVNRMSGAGKIRCLAEEADTDVVPQAIRRVMGEERSNLLARAINSGGRLIESLPFRNAEGNDVQLPNEITANVVAPETLIGDLRACGILTAKAFANAQGFLKSRPAHMGSRTPVVPGTPLFLEPMTALTLAQAGVFELLCRDFPVFLSAHALEELKNALTDLRKRREQAKWLEQLLDRLRSGLEEGVYRTLPVPSAKKREEIEKEDPGAFAQMCLLDLVSERSEPAAAYWFDDRHVNSHGLCNRGPIVTSLDIIRMLRCADDLSAEEWLEKRLHLRAGNFQMIPLEAEEIVEWLLPASVRNGEVVETAELRILRRSFAAALCSVEHLQLSPMPPNAPNQHGEVQFLLGANNSIRNAMQHVWSREDLDIEKKRALADWIWENLDFAGLPAWVPGDTSGTLFKAVHLASYLSLGFSIDLCATADCELRTTGYMEWIRGRVEPLLDCEPFLKTAVVEHLKSTLTAFASDELDETEDLMAKALVHNIFDGLPNSLSVPLREDGAIVDLYGVSMVPAVSIPPWHFDPDDLWRNATLAMQGTQAEIEALDEGERVLLNAEKMTDSAPVLIFEGVDSKHQLRQADDLFLLLDADAAQRLRVLRDHREWYDCTESKFRSMTAKAAGLADTRNVLSMTIEWRAESVAFHLQALGTRLGPGKSVPLEDFRPPSVAGLLRRYRLPSQLTNQSPPESLNVAAEQVLEEEGLEAALTRFCGLPTPLPSSLLQALSLLDGNGIRRILRNWSQEAASPMATFHQLRVESAIHSETLKDELADRVSILSDCKALLIQFEGLIALCGWVWGHLMTTEEGRNWTGSVRLAAAWLYSHEVYSTLMRAGASAELIARSFSQQTKTRLEDVFCDSTPEWDDVLHPRNVDPSVMTICALGYVYSGANDPPRQAQDLSLALSFFKHGEEEYPAAGMLADVEHLDDALGGLPAMRGSLERLLGARAQEVSSERLRDELSKAILRSENDPSDWNCWLTICLLLRDQLPEEGLRARLSGLLHRLDINLLIEQNLDVALSVLRLGARLAAKQDDEGLREAVRNRTLEVAKIEEIRPPSGNDETEATWRMLLETSIQVSRYAGNPEKSARAFSRLLVQQAEGAPEIACRHRRLLGCFCDRLPSRLTRELWPSLMRLRAMR